MRTTIIKHPKASSVIMIMIIGTDYLWNHWWSTKGLGRPPKVMQGHWPLVTTHDGRLSSVMSDKWLAILKIVRIDWLVINNPKRHKNSSASHLVSFKDFIYWLALNDQSKNPHFAPQTKMCKPCQNFNFLIKVCFLSAHMIFMKFSRLKQWVRIVKQCSKARISLCQMVGSSMNLKEVSMEGLVPLVSRKLLIIHEKCFKMFQERFQFYEAIIILITIFTADSKIVSGTEL